MKQFIQEDAHVYYVHPACEDEPVREGVVEQVHDDGTVDIMDEFLGSVNVELDMVFETREEAVANA